MSIASPADSPGRRALEPEYNAQQGPPLAIEISGLSKHYGHVRAVDDLDLHVPMGVVAGFVGPNGSGKTTTIRMLLGLVRPSSGTARVLGQPIDSPDRYLGRVGALVEGPAFTGSLTGRRNLRALSILGGHDPSRVQETLELVGLADRAEDPVRSYSLGMKQRLGIAAALLGAPDLLVLDEPTNGLDPAGIREVRQLLRDLADGGVTVFVSSHLLAEIEQICDWLVMIQGGSVRFQGTVAAAIEAQRAHLVVTAERQADALPALIDLCSEHGYAAEPNPDGSLVVHSPSDFAAVINREAMVRGITLVELRYQRPNLEEAFFRMLSEESA